MFGLGPSSRVFTKLMTAVIIFLRSQFGIIIVAYIDEQTCRLHAEITILVLQDLGYGVKFGKSALSPSTTVEHLGFTWDSNKMLVSLPQDKIDKIISRTKLALKKDGMTAANLRSLLGSLESLRLATTLAPLHFRSLQYLQPRPGSRQDFLVTRWLHLTTAARFDLQWCTQKFHHTNNTSLPLLSRPVSMEIWTDASGLAGWGGHCTRGGQVQGCWTSTQLPWHINLKEILAAKFSLETLIEDGDVINLHMDSQVAVSFVNKMGGTRSRTLCTAAIELWKLVLSRRGWVNAYWVPREDNEQADMLSKSSLETWDFGIRPDIALTLFEQFFRPRLDIFASRTFHVCKHYYTCCPDTRAIRADAFSVATWPDYSYAFPPLPLISKTLTKIKDSGITGLIVTPRWTGTPWWSRLLHMALREPTRLGRPRIMCMANIGARLPSLGTLMATIIQGRGTAARFAVITSIITIIIIT